MDLARNPNATDVPYIPAYGENRSVRLLSDKGLGLVAHDPARVARCEFLAEGLVLLGVVNNGGEGVQGRGRRGKMMGRLRDKRKKATYTVLSRDEEHCRRHCCVQATFRW
jgi:hypothetical protein